MFSRSSISRSNPGLKKKQHGFTALELGVVLIVGAIVVTVGISAGSKLFGDNTTTSEAQNIANLYSQTKNLKSTTGYGTAGTSLLNSLYIMGAIPKSMAWSDGDLANGWGGAVTVVSTGAGYSISYAGVPRAACIDLAMKISRGGSMTTKPGVGQVVTGEVTRETAISGCQSAESNSLVFGSLS